MGDQRGSTSHAPGYAGFIAGVASGISKVSVGHPFDTIKVRLQTAPESQFKGTLDCVSKTYVKEGIRGFYKGVTPPLVGWMIMDSIRILKKYVFTGYQDLPTIGHCLAGAMGGWTVSIVAGPVENIKARLQVQYDDGKTKIYKGPINCAVTLYNQRGIRGLYKGLSATLIFRSFFFFFWGTVDYTTRWMKSNTNWSLPVINFIAGGIAAQVYWSLAYPTDVVKQKIMTDSVVTPKYPTWMSAFKSVYKMNGLWGFWRGFLPCFIRAFPANAAALAAFEGTMRFLST